MKKIFVYLISCSFLSVLNAQTLVSDSVILHLNKSQVDSLYTLNGVPLFLFPTKYEINIHRVIYNTLDAHNNPTIASGLVILPENNFCPSPLISYQHGTQARKNQVFSNLRGEWVVGVAGAATGYAACMPDYIGLGVSPGLHPYQHAQTEANAVVDLLRAAREIAAREEVELSEEIYLLGYSQGGHATMAAHREIQENLAGEFTVTASAPLSGAYDMSGEQLDLVASFDPYSQPGYLPYLIFAYQDVYGTLYNSVSDIFVSPFDTLLPPLFDGNSSLDQVNNVMPSVPRLIIDTNYANAFFNNPNHPAQVALRDNDLYRWVPQAPVRMGYCESDEEVSYLNAFVARDSMIARGATSVEIVSRGNDLSHFECAQPSILFSKLWFDSLASATLNCGITGIFSRDFSSNEMEIYPNPAQNNTLLKFSNPNQEYFDVFVATTSGRVILKINQVKNEDIKLDVSAWSSGIYIVAIHNASTTMWGRFLKE